MFGRPFGRRRRNPTAQFYVDLNEVHNFTPETSRLLNDIGTPTRRYVDPDITYPRYRRRRQGPSTSLIDYSDINNVPFGTLIDTMSRNESDLADSYDEFADNRRAWFNRPERSFHTPRRNVTPPSFNQYMPEVIGTLNATPRRRIDNDMRPRRLFHSQENSLNEHYGYDENLRNEMLRAAIQREREELNPNLEYLNESFDLDDMEPVRHSTPYRNSNYYDDDTDYDENDESDEDYYSSDPFNNTTPRTGYLCWRRRR